ncbi:hypothetical protein ACLB9X_31875 [Streptomyces sp. 5K101]|uniref:hypothetical protein n=1 Tax=Streptomyces sp. 5K101 TaxID=3390037 RepID=UPI003976202E
MTRRLVGVLDITCDTGNDSPLLAPLIARAARDIEERLLQSTRRAEQRMLAAFQTAAAGRNRPVLVLGEGVVLANPSAVELLDPVDHFRLRELAAGIVRRGSGGCPQPHTVRSVELASGREVSVRSRPSRSGVRVCSSSSTSRTVRTRRPGPSAPPGVPPYGPWNPRRARRCTSEGNPAPGAPGQCGHW